MEAQRMGTFGLRRLIDGSDGNYISDSNHVSECKMGMRLAVWYIEALCKVLCITTYSFCIITTSGRVICSNIIELHFVLNATYSSR